MRGWKESITWLQTRYRVRRLLRHGKYMIGHDPIFLPILLRLTPMGISKEITDHTDIVVEGFPRSGNTFTVFGAPKRRGQPAAHRQSHSSPVSGEASRAASPSHRRRRP